MRKNKRYLIIVILQIISSTTTFSQDVIGKTFITNVPIYVRYHKIGQTKNDKKIDKTNFCADYDYIFDVVDIDSASNNYIINFWRFTKNATQEKKYLEVPKTHSDSIYYNIQKKYEKYVFIDSRAENFDFMMSPSDFTKKCSEYYPTANAFTSGAISLPVKLRFGNPAVHRLFTYEEKLNLGIAAGWQ